MSDFLPAAKLLDIARAFRRPPVPLLVPSGVEGWNDHDLAVLALALDFHSRGPAFHLRALTEEWSKERLIREMY